MEIEYKGYVAKVVFSKETDSFRGEVLNSPDLIAFHSSNVEEALVVMEEVIDDYLKYLQPFSISECV